MKTFTVDFSKRDEKNRLFLTPEQKSGIKLGEKIRLTDNDIAVVGVVSKKTAGKYFVLISWDSTEYFPPEKRRAS